MLRTPVRRKVEAHRRLREGHTITSLVCSSHLRSGGRNNLRVMLCRLTCLFGHRGSFVVSLSFGLACTYCSMLSVTHVFVFLQRYPCLEKCISLACSLPPASVLIVYSMKPIAIQRWYFHHENCMHAAAVRSPMQCLPHDPSQYEGAQVPLVSVCFTSNVYLWIKLAG